MVRLGFMGAFSKYEEIGCVTCPARQSSLGVDVIVLNDYVREDPLLFFCPNERTPLARQGSRPVWVSGFSNWITLVMVLRSASVPLTETWDSKI